MITTEFPFERDAMKGEPCPKRLDIADTCAYVALKHLYAMYNRGLISRKNAKEEKRTIVYNWQTDKSKLEFLDRSNKALSQKIGEASAAFAKDPNMLNAEKLYCAFYNLPENWRENK